MWRAAILTLVVLANLARGQTPVVSGAGTVAGSDGFTTVAWNPSGSPVRFRKGRAPMFLNKHSLILSPSLY